jgi:hypothetical protein
LKRIFDPKTISPALEQKLSLARNIVFPGYLVHSDGGLENFSDFHFSRRGRDAVINAHMPPYYNWLDACQQLSKFYNKVGNKYCIIYV